MVITVESFVCAGGMEGVRLPNEINSAVTAGKPLACYWEHVVGATEKECKVVDLTDREDVTFYGAKLRMKHVPFPG